MPAKLPEPQTKITINVNEADFELLRVMYPHGTLNGVLRAVVEAYANRLRERLAGSQAEGVAATLSMPSQS